MTLIALGALVAATVVCMLRAVSSQKSLNFRLGITGWDFSGSWASNLAAAGTVLGVVIGASGSLPTSGLALTAIVLSVLFGALTVLGPITYSALQVNQSGTLEGTLGGFYLACGLTLWAALGASVAAAAFFIDIAQKISPLIVALFFVVVVVGIVLLLRYAWLSMGWVAAQAVAPPPAGTPFAPRKLPKWSLI
jgi:hypothetical protein